MPNPRQRVTIETFLDQTSPIVNSNLVKLSESLPSLRIADDLEFERFMSLLKLAGEHYPTKYLSHKVLPLLVECYEANKGGIELLTMIIKLAKDLPVELYKTLITPVIIKQFANPNRAVRIELLQSLPSYIEYLDKRVVSDKIWPYLSQGFSDAEPSLREQTVRSVFTIAPKLNDRILNGDLLRQLAKVQNDAKKEIRANTTILLGKIASVFSQNTRVSVLVLAFARGLKDPFIESRLAALMALSSCEEYFGIQEICGKILGTIAPALVDKDAKVRKEAFKTFSLYFDKVKQHASDLDEKESSSSGGVGATSPSTPGWSGWASNLTLNLASKAAASASTSSLLGLSSSEEKTTTSAPTSTSTTPLSSLRSSQNRSITAVPSTIKKTSLRTAYKPEPEPEDEADAWGNGDDAWGNDENDAWDDNDDAWGSTIKDDDDEDEDAWGQESEEDDWSKSIEKANQNSSALNRSSNPSRSSFNSTRTSSNVTSPINKSFQGLAISNNNSKSAAATKGSLNLKSSATTAGKKQTFASTFGTTSLAQATNNSVGVKKNLSSTYRPDAKKNIIKKTNQKEDEEEDGWDDNWGV